MREWKNIEGFDFKEIIFEEIISLRLPSTVSATVMPSRR